MKSLYGTKILCIVVSLGAAEKTIESIHTQTIEPLKIVFANKKYNFRYVGERAGSAMRDALSKENLDDFTHVLRVDGDVTLPKRFIEAALNLDADLVGRSGYAQMITTKAFKELFDNRYPVACAEDSVLSHTVIASNKYTFAEPPIKPILPEPKKYSKDAWEKSGEEYYKLGYSVLGVLFTFKNHRSTTPVGFNVFHIIKGWLKAFVQKQEVHEFAKAHSRNKHFLTSASGKLSLIINKEVIEASEVVEDKEIIQLNAV